MRTRLMNSTQPRCPLALRTTFRPAHDWNTIRDTTPLMYSTRTDIHSRSSIGANDGTASPRTSDATTSAGGGPGKPNVDRSNLLAAPERALDRGAIGGTQPIAHLSRREGAAREAH